MKTAIASFASALVSALVILWLEWPRGQVNPRATIHTRLETNWHYITPDIEASSVVEIKAATVHVTEGNKIWTRSVELERREVSPSSIRPSENQRALWNLYITNLPPMVRFTNTIREWQDGMVIISNAPRITNGGYTTNSHK